MKYRYTCALLLAALAGAVLPAYAEEAAPKEASLPFAAAVKADGKWGAVNAEGQTIIPIRYDDVALSLTKDEAQRMMDLSSMDGRSGLIEVKNGKLRGFYDRSGTRIIPVSYEARSSWTDGAVAVQAKKKEIGFYRQDGKKLSDLVYTEASDFHDGAAVVRQEGKYGYLKIDGTVLPPVYEAARYFKDGLAPVKEKKWGVIDMSGQYVVPPTYDETGPFYSDGLLAVKKDGRWGFIDKTGAVAVPLTYRAVHPVFEEGLTAVQDENKLWGFLNAKGEVTVRPVFKDVLTPFSEGLAGVVTTDGKAYAWADGTIAFHADFDRIYAFEDGLAEYREGELVERRVRPSISIGWGWGWGWHHRHHPWGWGWGGWPWPMFGPWWYDPWYAPSEIQSQEKRGYIDTTGRIIASSSLAHVYPATDKGVLVFNKNRFGWIDKSGQYTIHTEYRALQPMTKDGYVIARNEKKEWGLLDFEGQALSAFAYDALQPLGGGCLAYKQEGKWGLMKQDGTLLTKPLYKEIGAEGSGLFPARTKDSWVYLDTAGREAITFPQKAAGALPFVNGYAGVKMDGQWGIIAPDGHFTVKPSYENYKAL